MEVASYPCARMPEPEGLQATDHSPPPIDKDNFFPLPLVTQHTQTKHNRTEDSMAGSQPSSPLSIASRTPPPPTPETPSIRKATGTSRQRRPPAMKNASPAENSHEPELVTRRSARARSSTTKAQATPATADNASSSSRHLDDNEGTSNPQESCNTSRKRKAPNFKPENDTQLPAPTPIPTPTIESRQNARNSAPKPKKQRTESCSEDELATADFLPVTRPVRKPAVTKLLTHSSSVLARREKVNLRKLLGSDLAWDSLTHAEKVKLVGMMPGYEEVFASWPPDQEVPNYLQDHLRTDSTFGEACSVFQDNLRGGYYSEAWLDKAAYAMKQRATGAWDGSKDAKVEQHWGQKQKVDWHAKAGNSSTYKLSDLVKAHCFEKEDVWSFERITRNRSGMKKEATIAHVDMENGLLSFSYPPGRHQSATEELRDGEVMQVTPPLDNPTPLLVAMMREDGRVPADERMSNAWKLVRVYRRNQDLGALFDIRESHASRAGS